MTEPSTQAVCEECTTPFAPDLKACPHCGLDNPQRAAFLAGVAPEDFAEVLSSAFDSPETEQQPAEDAAKRRKAAALDKNTDEG
jgi:hypothetical protein